MDRPTIADLARAAGVSISTVDRALNGRDPVRRQTAERVLTAARAIGFHAAGLIGQRLKTEQPERTFGFLLQQRSSHFYQELGEALNEATKACASVRGRAIVQYLDDLTPASVSDHLARLASEVDAIGVVAADHPHVTNAIDHLQRGGVPVFALISDLTAPGRAGYIGLDNWKVGRTAAWAVSRLARHPGKVGIFVGNHRYLCQDFCEMSFRSYFREHAPDFHILEALISLEEPRLAYENTLNLLRRNKDLVGLFVAGGGIEGVVQALRDEGQQMFGQIATIGLERTDATRASLIDGVIALVLSHPLKAVAETAVGAMAAALGNGAQSSPSRFILPFDIFTSENV